MNNRDFNKVINSVRTRSKKSLDSGKIAALAGSVKDALTLHIVRRRGPVLASLLGPSVDADWLASCGYFHRSVSPTTGEKFLHTAEHEIR